MQKMHSTSNIQNDCSTEVYREAIRELTTILSLAKRTAIREPRAMALATACKNGRPSVRIVLLNGLDERGLVFYTNLNSRKGRDLHENPQAAVHFYWEPLYRQATISGTVEPVSDEEADRYWMTRPRYSQLGAWASHQSEVLKSNGHLALRAAWQSLKFMGRDVQRPAHWSGFRLVPDAFDFWRSHPHYFPTRIAFRKVGARWYREGLFP